MAMGYKKKNCLLTTMQIEFPIMLKGAFKKKLEEGTILGDSPLGYLNKQRVDKKKEKVEVIIDPERGNLIKKIFENYASGMYSMQEIRDNFLKKKLQF